MCWLAFVFKTESCSLCSEFLNDLCYAWKLHADVLVIPLNFFRARYDFVLSLQTVLKLVQTKNSMGSHSISFSSGVWNLGSKV